MKKRWLGEVRQNKIALLYWTEKCMLCFQRIAEYSELEGTQQESCSLTFPLPSSFTPFLLLLQTSFLEDGT